MDKDRSFGWNNSGDDEPDEENYKPIPSRPDFFSAYLANRLPLTEKQSSNESNEDDDEEDEEKPKKKRKYAGLLNEIFPRVIAPEDKPKQSDTLDTTQQKSEENTENSPTERTSSITPDSNLVESQAPSADINESQPPELDPEDVDSDLENDEDLMILNDQEDIQIDHSTHAQARSEVSEPDDHSKNTETSTSTTTVVPPQFFAQPQQPVESQNADAVKATEPVPTPKSEIKEDKPTSKHDSSPESAFFGANYLARRRYKQLSKELERQKKDSRSEIRQLESVQLSQRQAQERLKVHQQEQAEKLNTLNKDSNKTELTPPKQDSVYNIIPPAPVIQKVENKQSLPPNEHIETVYQSPNKATPENPPLSRVDSRPEVRTNNFIQRETVVAKEVESQTQNQPEKVQTILENRHETLIRNRNRGLSTALNTAIQPTPSRSEQSLSNLETRQKSLSQSSVTAASKNAPLLTTYKQPVQYGVGVAIAILLLALIANALL